MAMKELHKGEITYRVNGKVRHEEYPRYAAMLQPGRFAQEAREERAKQARINAEVAVLRNYTLRRRSSQPFDMPPPHKGQAAYRVRRGQQ